jgi:hypothetical protein
VLNYPDKLNSMINCFGILLKQNGAAERWTSVLRLKISGPLSRAALGGSRFYFIIT